MVDLKWHRNKLATPAKVSNFWDLAFIMSQSSKSPTFFAFLDLWSFIIWLDILLNPSKKRLFEQNKRGRELCNNCHFSAFNFSFGIWTWYYFCPKKDRTKSGFLSTTHSNYFLDESTLFDKVSESLNRVKLIPLLTFPKLLFVADLWLLIARFVFFISKIIFFRVQRFSEGSSQILDHFGL